MDAAFPRATPRPATSATATHRATVLVVDDEVRSLEALRRTLDDDFTVFTAGSAEQAENVLRAEAIDIVLSDQRMPGATGVELLKRVRARWPEVVRIIISGYTDAEDIIGGVNEAGIWQYVLKPWRPDHLLHTLKSAVELARLQREHQLPGLELRQDGGVVRERAAARRERDQERFSFERLVRALGSPLDEVCALAARIATHELSVLVAGEPGTGKELLARAIHHASPRGDGPFVLLDCAGRLAAGDDDLHAALCGQRRGPASEDATGAAEERPGIFQQAQGGTLFLDEVGALSAAFQARLLRTLEDREFRPLGSARPVPLDVRIVSATRGNLEHEVRAGRLREDLYYRLAGVTLRLPPLRERPRDVPLLAQALLDRATREQGVPDAGARGFTPAALACLASHSWPGNVRELEGEVRRMLAAASGVLLGAELLSPAVAGGGAVDGPAPSPVDGLEGTLRERMEQLEARVILETLTRHRWNKSRAAEELGLTRAGLRAKMARYHLERE